VRILALDPGNEQTGYVRFDEGRVVGSGILPNCEVLELVERSAATFGYTDLLAIEMIASYGMPVGAEVFDTCVWIGRFIQKWLKDDDLVEPLPYRQVYRREVKIHLCGTSKAKDGNIRQALIDKLGPQGTKKNPGPTYGVKSHIWAALGVAVTAAETEAK
jgi:hypothetical protein